LTESTRDLGRQFTALNEQVSALSLLLASTPHVRETTERVKGENTLANLSPISEKSSRVSDALSSASDDSAWSPESGGRASPIALISTPTARGKVVTEELVANPEKKDGSETPSKRTSIRGEGKTVNYTISLKVN
jgi:hypothetical protein